MFTSATRPESSAATAASCPALWASPPSTDVATVEKAQLNAGYGDGQGDEQFEVAAYERGGGEHAVERGATSGREGHIVGTLVLRFHANQYSVS